MANITLRAKLLLKHDTKENWETLNPILLPFEMGIEEGEDGNHKFKFGDGVTAWNQLPYTFDLSTIFDKIEVSIGTDQIKDSAVTETKIADSSITTDKIKDGSVTASKIADMDTLKVGHASTADRATGDENGNRIISFYGHDLMLSINPQTYVMTITLVSEDGTVLATHSIDLPLESMVVSGTYDEVTKEVVLTLQNGQQVRFSIADLVDGLASQAALDAETQARKDADAALAQDISKLQNGTTPAGSASKLTTDNVGSAEKPVYFENGVPVACGDELDVDVSGKAANADNLGGVPASNYALKSEVASGVVYLDTLPEPTDTAPALVVVTGETNG